MPVPALLCGRAEELAILHDATARLPVTVIYGVAGVGKSSIAAALASRWDGARVYSRVVDSSLGMLLNDARRVLADDPVAELESNGRRLNDLARRLNDTRGIWLLDDMHGLDDVEAVQLLSELGRVLAGGRVLAMSRRRLPVRPGDPDRFEIKLSPLDESASRELWLELDKLYGAVGGFDTAFAWARGSPFALRRAHAGGAVTLDEEEPIASTLASLDEDSLKVARALALSRIGLSEQILGRVVPSERCLPVLRELFRRLVVEVDAAGDCTLHDLFRSVLLAGMDERERTSMHECLARALRDAPLATLVRIRETAFHLCAARLLEEAGAFLSQNAFSVIEHGGASDLLLTLESLKPRELAPSLETVRALLLVRTGECERGYRQLDSLRRRLEDPPDLLRFSLAQAATMTGRLSVADEVLSTFLRQHGADAPAYSRALRMLSVVRSSQGRMQDARDLLDRAEKAANTVPRLRKVEELRAFTYWFEGRYREAEEPMRRAQALLDLGSRPPGDLRLYITVAPLQANLGQFEDAERTLRESSQGLSDSEELLPAAYRVERAVLLGERGDRIDAIALLREAIEEETARGFRMSVWWARLQLGRNLLAMGRRAEALREYHAVEAECADAGVLALVEAVRREHAVDPLRPEDDPNPSAATVGTRVRRRCLAGLRAAERGETALAVSIVDEQQPVVGRAGYGLDRAILKLAQATVARLQGNDEAARDNLRRAKDEAARDNVDPTVFEELVASIGTARLIESSGASSLISQADEQGVGVAVDARCHALRIGTSMVDLNHRPIVRQVLYALARRPNASLSKDELANAVWGVSYHPLRHDNTIRVTIRRLRVLLEGSPMRIETAESGYRLVSSSRLVFLEGNAG